MTPKQKRFVNEYLIDLNATQAAIRAGYSTRNADKIGAQLLGKTRVAAAIRSMQDEISKRCKVDQERVVFETAQLAFSDVRKLFDDNGAMLPVKKWPDGIAAAVASIEVHEIGGGDNPMIVVKKIKFWDKGAALDKLFRHFGGYSKDHEQASISINKMMAEIAEVGRRDILKKRGPAR